MTDKTEVNEDQPLSKKEQLELLKKQADLLGIEYHPNIGLGKLKERVREAVNETLGLDIAEPEPAKAPEGKVTFSETDTQRRKRLIMAANKLVRVRVSCMNPNKSEWEGEILTVANDAVGSIKKFVPFNNEDGWHVPQFMVNMLKDRQYQHFYNSRDDQGNKIRTSRLAPEFNIEYMDPLTMEELQELARRQEARGGVGR